MLLSNVKCTLMGAGHAEQCSRIDSTLFPDNYYVEDRFLKYVQRTTSILPVVAVIGSQVIGYHIFNVTKQSTLGVRTVVDPKYRRMDVGTLLLDYQHRYTGRKPCYYRMMDGVDPTELFIAKQDFLRHCGYKLFRVYHGEWKGDSPELRNTRDTTYLYKRSSNV